MIPFLRSIPRIAHSVSMACLRCTFAEVKDWVFFVSAFYIKFFHKNQDGSPIFNLHCHPSPTHLPTILDSPPASSCCPSNRVYRLRITVLLSLRFACVYVAPIFCHLHTNSLRSRTSRCFSLKLPALTVGHLFSAPSCALHSH